MHFFDKKHIASMGKVYFLLTSVYTMKNNTANKTRLWEIDFLRGIAIICMVIYHFFFDLVFFAGVSIDLYSTGWNIFQKSIATCFIMVAGISLYLKYQKQILLNKVSFFPFFERGFFIFFLGMVITGITFIALGNAYIRFGILHLIGLSIILAYPFLKYPLVGGILGLLILTTGFISLPTVHTFWLLPFGFMYASFVSVDYFPLLPWFGVMLLGIWAGKCIFPQGKRRFIQPLGNKITTLLAKNKSKNIRSKTRSLYILYPVQFIAFLGKNSLLIYMIHQPILLSIIFIFMSLFS